MVNPSEGFGDPGGDEYRSWATSGEILFRSGFYGSDRGDVWPGIFQAFGDLLDGGAGRAVLSKRKHDRVEKEIDLVKDCVKRIHDYRMRVLTSRLRKTEEVIERALASIDLNEERLREKHYDRAQAMDNDLLTHCAHFAASIEKQCLMLNKQLALEHHRNQIKIANMKKTLELEQFALHLAHETNDQVTLKRLNETNPQFIRCKRACQENVKAEFFGTTSNYSGISVMEVFKIENRPMLKQFQKMAAKLKPGSVKGLFCTIPEESLERVVIQGMRGEKDICKEEDSHDSQGKTVLTGKNLFSQVQYCPFPNDQVSSRFAEERFNRAKDAPFPATFSRYSTLEANRHLMESKQSDQEETTEPVRTLALSRVIIGECFCTSNQYEGFPNIPTSGSSTNKFDSMFSSGQDEYLMLNPNYVLPEFLIRYKFRSRFMTDAPAESTGPATDTRAIEPDFSAPVISTDDLQLLAETTHNTGTFGVIPAGLPGMQLSNDRCTHPSQKATLRGFVETAEVQAGKDVVQKNAEAQRQALWSKIAKLLLRAKEMS
uniref:Uncharacterized protein n=1 Tax=Mucochytrium quahogii TaxID=96639 RepID=A0A7S2W257_9STRA|mmetsp:Transcript_19449/g.32002  ORF Transcript_19449/g.32002 Transcript_19449/m.32002 type:complete len:544 (-) Transcript_19449:846-2477(-)|eukprot:CAMPEP_0203745034 /NCGR_PEP_ID=MMETSP0098-20131031/907_1 /ASSEMBLY_ACC=CAM_ASM_000208 /TAXON_ID=96639 /ORGANISM=" , Strain NY0313808BC1" /LENGTH=543 /DNA_ID=CAMNT_0050632715 /DNA_START=147 /DNA_END=1778 /DNA_ORIENTATION=+